MRLYRLVKDSEALVRACQPQVTAEVSTFSPFWLDNMPGRLSMILESSSPLSSPCTTNCSTVFPSPTYWISQLETTGYGQSYYFPWDNSNFTESSFNTPSRMVPLVVPQQVVGWSDRPGLWEFPIKEKNPPCSLLSLQLEGNWGHFSQTFWDWFVVFQSSQGNALKVYSKWAHNISLGTLPIF